MSDSRDELYAEIERILGSIEVNPGVLTGCIIIGTSVSEDGEQLCMLQAGGVIAEPDSTLSILKSSYDEAQRQWKKAPTLRVIVDPTSKEEETP